MTEFQVGQTVEARYWKSELHPQSPPWYKGEIVAINTLSDGSLSYDIRKEMGGLGIAFEIRAIESDPEPAKAEPTNITTTVRPNGSYSNYLAYGTIENGAFKRVGYPKNILTPIYGKSSGTRGSASYNYDISFSVPADFEYFIVKVGSGKQTGGDLAILYTPKGK